MPDLQLNALDVALGLVVLGSTFHATRRGMLREGSVYLGLAAAMYVAGRYTVPALRWLDLAEGEPLVRLVVYLALLGVVLVTVAAATAALRPLTHMPGLWLIDRLGGALVGAGQGLVLGAVLLSAAWQVSNTLVAPQMAGSQLAPLALRALEQLLSLAPRDILP